MKASRELRPARFLIIHDLLQKMVNMDVQVEQHPTLGQLDNHFLFTSFL